MQYRHVVVLVVGFWAVMMASLVRRWLLEVRPEHIPGTYRSVLTPERQHYQSRMAIYLPGLKERAGYTETVFRYTPDRRYEITNTTRVQKLVPGELAKLGRFALDSVVVVNRHYGLEEFSMTLSSPLVQGACSGRVVGDALVVRTTLQGAEEQVHRLPLPAGGLVVGGLSPLLGLPPLRVGQRWAAAVLNPLTLAPEQVEIEVKREESLEWGGETWETHVVEIRSGLLTAYAWVSPNGEVLKERTAFGLTLVKERVLEEDARPTGRRAASTKSQAPTPKQVPNPNRQ